MNHRELAAPGFAHVIEREARDTLACLPGYDLNRLGRVRVDHALTPDVQVLAVLAENDEIDVIETRFDPRIIARRPDIDEELQFLAQRDSHARIHAVSNRHRVRVAERRLSRPFQGKTALGDRTKYARGQRCALIPAGLHAGTDNIPRDVDTVRINDLARGLGDFRTDAIARDQ